MKDLQQEAIELVHGFEDLLHLNAEDTFGTAKQCAIKHCDLNIAGLNKLDYRVNDVFPRNELVSRYKQLIEIIKTL